MYLMKASTARSELVASGCGLLEIFRNVAHRWDRKTLGHETRSKAMIIRNRKSKRGLRQGIAAVELAMLAPVLFFMFLVVWDFSRIFYYAVVMAQCARNGARWAGDPNYFNNPAVATDPYTSVTAAALADAKNITPIPTVTDPPSYGNDANGNPYTQVTVTYQFTTVVNYSFPGLFTIPNTVSLSRTCQMRVAPVLPSGV